MIAATYTPVCLLVLNGALRVSLLAGAWVAAATGLLLAVFGIAQRRGVGLVLYLSMGWLAAVAMPEALRRVSGGDIALLVAGGVIYTLGVLVLASRWPDPSPRIFGYHEVWHTMVIAASACHWLVIFALLRAA
jgi:hemolysin III